MSRVKRVVLFVSLFAVAGCAAEKSSNPLSPTVAGPIPGVEISAPTPLEPATGQLISSDRQPITLLLENASTNGERPLTYVFEVATDAEFGNKVFAREAVAPGDGGRTSLRLSDALGSGRNYYWRARAQDGANTGPYSAAIVFNVFTPVVIEAPLPMSPAGNTTTSNLRPDFKLQNAPRSGPAGAISYTLELAQNDSFANKFAIWQFNEQANETKFTTPTDLAPGAQYFWHVRASDGRTDGPWSRTEVFRTPAPVVVVPPSGPAAPSGGACATSTLPINIVQCRRSQFSGTMSSSQMVTFLRGVASDLNRAGVAGGPFGILRKSGGANCGGYSCDIICAGQGTSQRQWDVLGDADGAQTPAWIGPTTYPNIRVDTCEIQ